MRILASIQLWLWCRTHIKPFQTDLPYNSYENADLSTVLKSLHSADKKNVVSIDKTAVHKLKRLLSVDYLKLGTWEWWENMDDNPYWCSGCTPGIMLPIEKVPEWMKSKGKESPSGYFFPVYISEFS